MDIVNENQDIRRREGFLAQNPNFYEHMSAYQIMDFTARFFFRGPDNLIRERIDETLKLVGLDDKADRPVCGFSGGERQRLGIAQAQVNYPDLLILDEPAAALDPQGRRDVLEVMEKLRKHTTIFFSTHILDDVQRVSDRVIILNHGELIAQGSVEKLLSASMGLNYRLVLKGDASRAQKHLQSFTWVLSKPASRVAFYLSKLLNNGFSILILMMVIPFAIAFVLLWSKNPELNIPGFLTAFGILIIHTFFYLSVSLMVGVFAEKRSMVLAITLAGLLGGQLMMNIVKELMYFTPFGLSQIMAGVANEGPLAIPGILWLPVGVTLLLSLIFVLLSIWKIQKLEF